MSLSPPDHWLKRFGRVVLVVSYWSAGLWVVSIAVRNSAYQTRVYLVLGTVINRERAIVVVGRHVTSKCRHIYQAQVMTSPDGLLAVSSWSSS